MHGSRSPCNLTSIQPHLCGVHATRLTLNPIGGTPAGLPRLCGIMRRERGPAASARCNTPRRAAIAADQQTRPSTDKTRLSTQPRGKGNIRHGVHRILPRRCAPRPPRPAHEAPRTEKTHVLRIRQFIEFSGKRHSPDVPRPSAATLDGSRHDESAPRKPASPEAILVGVSHHLTNAGPSCMMFG